MPKITPQEALIYVMITMSAADRQISDRELDRIAQVVKQMPVFMGFDENNLAKTAERCGDLLSQDDGLEELLNRSRRPFRKNFMKPPTRWPSRLRRPICACPTKRSGCLSFFAMSCTSTNW